MNNTNWNQGVFYPENPDKCINEERIIYRSYWERKMNWYLDTNPNIIKWGSESIKINYSDLSSDGKIRTYVTDYIFTAKTRTGEKTFIAEVKPKNQHPHVDENGNFVPPPLPTKQTKKSMKNWQYTYDIQLKNYSKWIACKEYCKENGFEFIVIDEDHLALK